MFHRKLFSYTILYAVSHPAGLEHMFYDHFLVVGLMNFALFMYLNHVISLFLICIIPSIFYLSCPVCATIVNGGDTISQLGGVCSRVSFWHKTEVILRLFIVLLC